MRRSAPWSLAGRGASVRKSRGMQCPNDRLHFEKHLDCGGIDGAFYGGQNKTGTFCSIGCYRKFHLSVEIIYQQTQFKILLFISLHTLFCDYSLGIERSNILIESVTQENWCYETICVVVVGIVDFHHTGQAKTKA